MSWALVWGNGQAEGVDNFEECFCIFWYCCSYENGGGGGRGISISMVKTKDYLMNGSQQVCNMVIGQLAYWVLRLIRFARVELLVLWAWFLSKV